MNNNIFSRLLQHKHKMAKKSSNVSAFTIVELLIVIVIIGILAAITIVSYTGITKKANEATLQAELSNASKKLAIYYAQYNTYPQTLDSSNCPATPTVDKSTCLKFNSDTTFTYTYKTPSTYDLTATKGSLTYKVTESTGPVDVSGATTPITAIGSITGTAQEGSVLTAGAITPAAATVSYQWQSSDTSNGTYTNIAGATSSTYTLKSTDINKYIKVVVTGTGSYSGTQTSTASSAVAYSWITIGTQTWSKYNLNVGTMVTGVTEQTNNSATEKYCYNDDEANCTTYGGLYQWDEAMNYSTTEGAQGICPAGSHIPTDAEWKTLEMQLGMTQTEADKQMAWRGTDQSTQLKSGGGSGLNVPLAGYRYTDGSYNVLSSDARLWSSSVSSTFAWFRGLRSSQAGVYRNMDVKANGFSVRCLKN